MRQPQARSEATRTEGPPIGHYVCLGSDARGIPKYDRQHFKALNAPPGFSGIDKIIYIPANDTMYLMGNSLSQLACYPHWSTGNRNASWTVQLPTSNAQPAGIAVAGSYVFINDYVPHQILVYNAANGSNTGTMV